MSRPVHDERDPCAAFVAQIFPSPEVSRRMMLPILLARTVVVTVKQNRSIIAREEHKRPFGGSGLFQGSHDFSDQPIKLHNGVSPNARRTLPAKAGVRQMRNVRI